VPARQLGTATSRRYVGHVTIDANAIFEDELSRRGCSFVRVDEQRYCFEVEGSSVTVNLENVRRDAEREGDPDAIRRFVDTVFAAISTPSLSWAEASSALFWSAEGAIDGIENAVRVVVSAEVNRVLTLTDVGRTKVTWVTPEMCAEWGVTIEQAGDAASRNQDTLLDGIQLDVTQAAGERLGMIPLHPPYKASVIFAPSFRSFVEPALGWPVLAVVPCRDFVYVLADGSPLVDRLGSIVVEQFQTGGYPITTELLRISDDGVEAIGRFPTGTD